MLRNEVKEKLLKYTPLEMNSINIIMKYALEDLSSDDLKRASKLDNTSIKRHHFFCSSIQNSLIKTKSFLHRINHEPCTVIFYLLLIQPIYIPLKASINTIQRKIPKIIGEEILLLIKSLEDSDEDKFQQFIKTILFKSHYRNNYDDGRSSSLTLLNFIANSRSKKEKIARIEKYLGSSEEDESFNIGKKLYNLLIEEMQNISDRGLEEKKSTNRSFK